MCTTELGRVGQLSDEWDKRNTKVIALSVDSVEDHNSWKPDVEELSKTTDTSSVRSVFIISPDNTVKLMLTYPKSVGRNFDEILRVLDALQLNESGPSQHRPTGSPEPSAQGRSGAFCLQPGDRLPVAGTRRIRDFCL